LEADLSAGSTGTLWTGGKRVRQEGEKRLGEVVFKNNSECDLRGGSFLKRERLGQKEAKRGGFWPKNIMKKFMGGGGHTEKEALAGQVGQNFTTLPGGAGRSVRRDKRDGNLMKGGNQRDKGDYK